MPDGQRLPVRSLDGAVDPRSLDVLVRAVGIFGWVVLAVGLFWGAVGIAILDESVAGSGVVATVFGAWMLLERRRAGDGRAATLATRVAVATQVAAVAAVFAQPVIGPAIAIGSLVPVVVALLYVDRRRLTVLMLGSAGVGVFSSLAASVFPWGTRSGGVLELILPTSTTVIVYLLFQVFLWAASTRMTDSSTELRHVVEMSRDLAGTLDPSAVGGNLARHLHAVTRARDATLSTWDRTNDRVVTFGHHPSDEITPLEPSYDLARYPATRRALVQQVPVVIDVDDPLADAAEVDLLRSEGRHRLLMLPLVVRGESIGIVELTSDDPKAFDDRQIELAKILTREAALTFDNARLHAEVKEQAYRDSLTGLANRARFQERVDHALARLKGRSPLHVAILFIDLDQFKHVNDRFGHATGDRVLQVIAERVRTTVRPGDTACRLGGDEFAVLLEDVDDLEEADVVAQRLLDRFEEPIELDDVSTTIAASIGEAMSGLGGETADELLRNADIAMYAAKAAGRGQVVAFRSELLELAAARSELTALLRGADLRDELQLHFQPIVELSNGAPVGVEALVRWQPRGHELHMPAEFIGLAEETGEILAIGRWVILEACRRVRAWQDRFELPDLRLYVNLSARQFRDPELLPIVAGALADSGLSPHHLSLELTESALLSRTPDTLERIGALRRLGVRLAIDDFGTGYSSLGYLHAFQVDELKIDRAFVSGPAEPRDAEVIGRAIVELGHALGLDLVAEGIETTDQAELFRTLGCRYGQGFLYTRPLPATELERWLRRPRDASEAA